MESHFNSEYPSVEHLRAKAKSRMPGFAYDYLTAGCFTEINLARNNSDIRNVQLKPWYLREETSKYTDLMADGRAREFTYEQECNSVVTSPSPEKPMRGKGKYWVEGLA